MRLRKLLWLYDIAIGFGIAIILFLVLIMTVSFIR